jgi:pyruvate kinase
MLPLPLHQSNACASVHCFALAHTGVLHYSDTQYAILIILLQLHQHNHSTGTDSILFRAIDIGKEKGWVKTGDAIVCVHGAKEAVAGSTNSLRVLTA